MSYTGTYDWGGLGVVASQAWAQLTRPEVAGLLIPLGVFAFIVGVASILLASRGRYG